jgi:hypothetical protein
VVLTDDGRFLLSLVDDGAQRCLAIADVAAATVSVRQDLCGLLAIRAAGPGRALLLGSDGITLSALSLPSGALEILHVATTPQRTLVVSPGGHYAALATVPQRPSDMPQWDADPYALFARRVDLVRTADGVTETFVTAAAARDLDLTETQLVVTMSWWDKFGVPNTTLQIVNLESMALESSVDFQNCADDLKIQPGGTLAALAPRTCSLHATIVAQPEVVEEWQDWSDAPLADPVSLVDLSTGEHRGNTPGFGPVEWSPDGTQVVGFTDRETLMVEWNTFTTLPFGVILVDADAMTWSIVEVGESVPQYFFTSAGDAVVVRARIGGVERVGRVDVATEVLSLLDGPAISLTQRVMAPDGAALVSDGGALYRLAAPETTVAPLATGVVGDLLHVRPQGDLVVWTDRAGGAHHLLDAATLLFGSTLTLPGPIAP